MTGEGCIQGPPGFEWLHGESAQVGEHVDVEASTNLPAVQETYCPRRGFAGNRVLYANRYAACA